jgi:hypothetical protein
MNIIYETVYYSFFLEKNYYFFIKIITFNLDPRMWNIKMYRNNYIFKENRLGVI